jgi:hypothetical protein
LFTLFIYSEFKDISWCALNYPLPENPRGQDAMKTKQFNGSFGPKSGCTLYGSICEGEEKPLVEGNKMFLVGAKLLFQVILTRSFLLLLSVTGTQNPNHLTLCYSKNHPRSSLSTNFIGMLIVIYLLLSASLLST